MGKFFEEIPDFLIEWIKKQEVFWVASAPLTADGHVNVSPKGLHGTFHIVNSHQVWYEDMTGSGVETISHLRENGRITVMFSAYEGPARIVRLFGKGKLYEFGTPEYESCLPAEQRHPGSRAVIFIDVYKVGSSCGYAVPYYEFKSHRTQLLTFLEKKETLDKAAETSDSLENTPGLKAYWEHTNASGLDGLPGLITAPASKHSFNSRPIRLAETKFQTAQPTAIKDLLHIKMLLSFLAGMMATFLFMNLADIGRKTFIVTGMAHSR